MVTATKPTVKTPPKEKKDWITPVAIISGVSALGFGLYLFLRKKGVGWEAQWTRVVNLESPIMIVPTGIPYWTMVATLEQPIALAPAGIPNWTQVVSIEQPIAIAPAGIPSWTQVVSIEQPIAIAAAGIPYWTMVVSLEQPIALTPTYTLAVSVATPAVGWVLISPDKPVYSAGETVTLTAYLDNWAIGYYTFDHWMVNGVGFVGNQINIVMDENKVVVAYFVWSGAF
jgi:hypothetical protein